MGGGDKGLRHVGGEPILHRLARALRPQVAALAVNANGDAGRFAALGLPVVPDTLPDYPGPLAGVLAGLDWAAAHHPGLPWVVTVPGDCPFIPPDLLARLHAERGPADLACAASAGRAHPVVALWPVSLREPLRAAVQGGLRKIDAFTGRYAVASVEWPAAPVDPFFNVNTPDDVAEADRLATLHAWLPTDDLRPVGVVWRLGAAAFDAVAMPPVPGQAELVMPDLSYAASYLAARREGYVDSAGDLSPPPDADALPAHLAGLNRQGGTLVLPDGTTVDRVPHAHLWLVAAGELVGRVSIRYRLNDALERFGGHLGYEIRPSCRRQGFGHRALALGLAAARTYGLFNLLLTCDDGNAASARIIERAGGTLLDIVSHPHEPAGQVRRYRIGPTAS